jgi:hypothetical protein
LKGAAGGYGFPTITEVAARVNSAEDPTGEVALLVDMCRRASAKAA